MSYLQLRGPIGGRRVAAVWFSEVIFILIREWRSFIGKAAEVEGKSED